MNESEKRYVRRQYNYNRVPNPLVEGLVFAHFPCLSPRGQKKAAENIRRQQAENIAVLKLEVN